MNYSHEIVLFISNVYSYDVPTTGTVKLTGNPCVSERTVLQPAYKGTASLNPEQECLILFIALTQAWSAEVLASRSFLGRLQ